MLEMKESDAKIVAKSASRRIGRPLSEDEKQDLAFFWLKRSRKTDSYATCNWQSVGDFIMWKLKQAAEEQKVLEAAEVHRDNLRADRCIVAAVGRRYGIDGLQVLKYRNSLPHLQRYDREPPTFVHPSEFNPQHPDADPFDTMPIDDLRRFVCAAGEALQWELQGLGEAATVEASSAE